MSDNRPPPPIMYMPPLVITGPSRAAEVAQQALQAQQLQAQQAAQQAQALQAQQAAQQAQALQAQQAAQQALQAQQVLQAQQAAQQAQQTQQAQQAAQQALQMQQALQTQQALQMQQALQTQQAAQHAQQAQQALQTQQALQAQQALHVQQVQMQQAAQQAHRAQQAAQQAAQRAQAAQQRAQQAAVSKPVSQPDSIRALTPTRIKELEGLIAGGYYQETINRLVGYKYFDGEINLDLLANRTMTYNPDRKSDDASAGMPAWDYLKDRAQPSDVKIGPKAFSSVAYLYSVIMHEYQHVLWRQTLANQNRSHLAHDQGFQRPDEVKAGARELLHATETGVAHLPDKVAQIWENLNDAFWKLDAQAQASERQSVIQALEKAKTFMKGSGLTLVPFRKPGQN